MTKTVPDALTNAMLLPGPQQKRVRGYRDQLTGCFVIQIGDVERLELPPENAVAMAVGILHAFGIEMAIGQRPQSKNNAWVTTHETYARQPPKA